LKLNSLLTFLLLQKSYKKGASNLCISDCIGTALKTSPKGVALLSSTTELFKAILRFQLAEKDLQVELKILMKYEYS